MPKIVPIVEGPGEVKSVPALLSRILVEMARYDVQVDEARNAHGCSNLLKPGGLEKFVEIAASVPDCGTILILMDADRQCAVQIAQDFSRRVQAIHIHRPVQIVIAKCEYEAWFLASLETIAGHNLEGRPGLPAGLTYNGEVEARIGVKEWLNQHFQKGRIYKETGDQVLMTRLIDTEHARRRSRSFRRLWHAVEEALDAIDQQNTTVTPQAGRSTP
jgi:hypothetical protein